MFGRAAALAANGSVWETYGQPVVSTVLISAVAIVMLGLSIAAMEKLTPFSIRKELEDDHNVSVAIVMGSVVIGVALVIAAVAKG